VRERETLRRAHSVRAAYLPPMQTETGLTDFCEISPELSRDARGLRVWLPLKMHGAAAFRAELDEKLDLAQHAADVLRRVPGVEIIAEPELSLLAFRFRPEGMSEGEPLDALNRRLLALVNERQRVLLTSAIVPRGFVIRICIVSFRTHRDRVDAALEDIASSLAELPTPRPAAGC
jgi:aromatic-L-amino-acid decarboxylase